MIKKDKCGCDTIPVIKTFERIKNVKLWIDFEVDNMFEIYYGISNTFKKPVRNKSDIATNALSKISNAVDGVFIQDIKFDNKDYIRIVDFESKISDYVVMQLELFKGNRYQLAGNVFKLKITYDLD